MAKRIIRMGLVSYYGADDVRRWARKGDEVELSADESKRLDAIGALEPTRREPAKREELPAANVEGDKEPAPKKG